MLAARSSTLKVDVICEMLHSIRVQSLKSKCTSHEIQTVERRHYVGLLVGCVCLDYCYMQIYAN